MGTSLVEIGDLGMDRQVCWIRRVRGVCPTWPRIQRHQRISAVQGSIPFIQVSAV